jgi:hypothetical protein
MCPLPRRPASRPAAPSSSCGLTGRATTQAPVRCHNDYWTGPSQRGI